MENPMLYYFDLEDKIIIEINAFNEVIVRVLL